MSKQEKLYNKNFDRNEKKPEEEKKEERITKKDVLSFILYILVIFCLTLLMITFVGQRTRVDGSSMENTLSDGDNLIVDKISYRFKDIERFDIVIFPYYGPGAQNSFFSKTYFIKRVIGLPGETVYIDSDGNIYINGALLEENYGREKIINPGMASSPIKLGVDEYFVLGDNRNNSTDSRVITVGPIQGENIVGRAWLRFYPFNKFGTLLGK